MKRQTFYLLFSILVSLVWAGPMGLLVGMADEAAGLAIFIGLFGHLLSNLLIRMSK